VDGRYWVHKYQGRALPMACEPVAEGKETEISSSVDTTRFSRWAIGIQSRIANQSLWIDLGANRTTSGGCSKRHEES